MLSFRYALAAAMLCTLAASSAFAQSGEAVLPTKRMLGPHGLERVWWNQATLDPSRDRVRHLVADEEVVVVQTRNGVVTAFDANDGKKLWASRLGRTAGRSYPALMNERLVLVVIGTNVFAVNKFSGSTAWEFNLPAAPSATLEMDDERVYFGALDGSVFAFSLEKIQEYYSEKLLPQWSTQTMVWRYKTDHSITTPPVVAKNFVNFANKRGSLYSVSAGDRKLSFQFETDSPITTPLVRSKGFLYVASEDFRLYCLRVENGTTRWTYNSGLAIRKPAQVIDQDVFLNPSGGGIHCVDGLLGKRKWWRPKIEDFVAASPDRVYVTHELGDLQILDRETGAVQASLGMRNFSIRLANHRTDRIYIAKPSGLLVCIREQGREFPLYYKHPERRPILPEFTPEPGDEKKNGEKNEDDETE